MYKRDHTTILHAKRKLEELLLVDDKIIQTVRLLETILFNRTVSVSDVASH
jgi:chromosomal replication initiation ATPase DnaA